MFSVLTVYLFVSTELRQREADRERQKREWEMKERQQEEQRRVDEDMMRRQQEEMQLRMLRQEEEMRRRQQENTLFMQVGELGLAAITGAPFLHLPVITVLRFKRKLELLFRLHLNEAASIDCIMAESG